MLTFNALRTGAIHVGDRILAINGISLQGKRVSEAMQMLQQSADSISLKIARFAVDHSRFTQHHLAHVGLDRPPMSFQDHFVDRVREFINYFCAPRLLEFS